MNEIISKELLSEVLVKKVIKIYFENEEGDDFLRENEISYTYIEDMQGMGCIEHEIAINIYELAHKCKEWAFHKGYDIIETDFMISIRKKSDRYSLKVYEYTEEEQNEQNVFKPEYTFKACQWILDNKDKQ